MGGVVDFFNPRQIRLLSGTSINLFHIVIHNKRTSVFFSLSETYRRYVTVRNHGPRRCFLLKTYLRRGVRERTELECGPTGRIETHLSISARSVILLFFFLRIKKKKNQSKIIILLYLPFDTARNKQHARMSRVLILYSVLVFNVLNVWNPSGLQIIRLSARSLPSRARFHDETENDMIHILNVCSVASFPVTTTWYFCLLFF